MQDPLLKLFLTLQKKDYMLEEDVVDARIELHVVKRSSICLTDLFGCWGKWKLKTVPIDAAILRIAMNLQ